MSLRSMSRAVALTTALVAGVGVAGCASGGGPEPGSGFQATLSVENDSPSTVNVYAVRGGTRFRLGTVVGLKTEQFELKQYMLESTGELRVVLDPLGSTRTYPAEPIYVQNGDVIQLQVSHLVR